MGPVEVTTYPGTQALARHQRAKREPDYGRRGGGYVFGIFLPHSGLAMTASYSERTTPNWLDFLEKVEQWVPREHAHIVAIVDNLSVHRSLDVLLFLLEHPRWAFLFQPSKAGYLNLIEPWWKVLRSLALKGKRFETWADVASAIDEATSYWNNHRHPFKWGHRRKRNRRSLTAPALPGIRLAA